MPAELFSVEQVERARRYHRPLYLALLLDETLGLAALSVLAFTRAGSWLYDGVPGAAFPALVVGFTAPIVLEPLFNRFAPLRDEELADRLRALARRAGVPVRDVLVADASRRTRKVNAYVSGLGATRRVVLFDTLLPETEPRQVELVVAHELGHRRARHVVKGTVVGMLGAVVVVVVLWALVADLGDLRNAPLVLLVASALELVGLPAAAAVSRRWEREADRFSLDVTRDPEAFETAHRELATANLSDLHPPRPVYALLFTHPTPPERIAAGRAWAARRPCNAPAPPATERPSTTGSRRELR